MNIKTSIGIIVVGVVIMAGGFWTWGHYHEPLYVFEMQLQKTLNAQFADTNGDFAHHIKSMHWSTINYRGGHVLSLITHTRDGNSHAGNGGDNVKSVEVVAQFDWDNMVTKTGFTKVSFVFDPMTQKVTEAKCIESSSWLLNSIGAVSSVDWKTVMQWSGPVILKLITTHLPHALGAALGAGS
ncbi:MAG: hypothetical protein WC614_13075 [bacterium]